MNSHVPYDNLKYGIQLNSRIYVWNKSRIEVSFALTSQNTLDIKGEKRWEKKGCGYFCPQNLFA